MLQYILLKEGGDANKGYKTKMEYRMAGKVVNNASERYTTKWDVDDGEDMK